MTKYFMTSKHFDKKTPNDFGLHEKMSDFYIRDADNTHWKRRDLCDFGWGNEMGFYRVPILNYEKLFEVIINQNEEDDKYYASAVLLADFPSELLARITKIIQDKEISNFLPLFEILGLDNPRNHCSTLNISYADIENDYNKWVTVAKAYQEYILEHHVKKIFRWHLAM